MSSKYRVYLLYTLEFAVIAAAIIYSFGNFSLIYGGDGYSQIYMTMVYCGKYLRSLAQNILQGNLSIPQFDFSIGLGEGIIPALNYYGFGDPFMLVSAIFPVKYSAYAYTVIILLKMYVSGISFIVYGRQKKYREEYILAGAPVYAASAYVFYFGFQLPSYLNVMISLPLVCAGIDAVIGRRAEKETSKEGLNVLLILAVAFQSVSGFYLLYMELLFAAVYALVGILCKYKTIGEIIKKIIILFIHVVMGIALGAVIFFPAVYGYISSSRGGSFVWPGWKEMFGAGPDGYWSLFSQIIVPVKYSGMGLTLPAIAVLVIVLALWKEKKDKELKILFVITLLAYLNTHFISWIAGGFSKAVYNNRWAFIMMFMCAVFVCMGGSLFEGMTTKTAGISALAGILYIGCTAVLENIFFQDGRSGRRELIYFVYGSVILLLFLLWMLLERTKNGGKKYLLTGGILFGCILNIYTIFSGTQEYGYGIKWYFKTYEGVRNEILASNAQLYSTEGSFGRLDIEGNVLNESLYTGHYGTGEYLSILNGNLYDFFKNYAIVSQMKGTHHHLTGLEARSGIEDLLSVAWYDAVETDTVAENKDYLPLGVTFDTYILEDEAEKTDAITKNAMILEKVILDQKAEGVKEGEIGNDYAKLLSEEAFDIEYVNVEREEDALHVTEESKIIITLKEGTPGEYYLYADRFQLLQGKADWYWVPVRFENRNYEFVSEKNPYYNGIQMGLFCLGEMDRENPLFEIAFTEEAEFAIENIRLYRIDTRELKKLNQERQQEVLEDIKVESNRVQGNIRTEEKKILFLGIPYSSGWKAYVNGERTEIYKADYGFMALVTEAGENEILLEYSTPGLRIGLGCTLGVGVFLGIFVWRRKRKKQQ